MSNPNPEFYNLDTECTNCHISKKGFEIPKGAKLNDLECPNCGMKTMVESARTTSYYDFGNNGWNF